MDIINTNVTNIMNFINQFGYSPEQIIQICELIITTTKGRNNICEDMEIIQENIQNNA